MDSSSTSHAHIGAMALRTNVHMGNHTLVADEPLDAGGQDLGPSPDDLLMAALASCMSITARLYANHKNWPMESLSVVVNLIREENGTVVFETTTTPIGETLSPEQHKRIIQIANRCPVHRVLEKSSVFKELSLHQ